MPPQLTSSFPTWSSLYASASTIARKALLRGKAAQKQGRGASKGTVEQAANLTQLFCVLREKIENNPEGRLHMVALVAEELRLFFEAPAIAVFDNGLCVHRSLTQREFDLLKKKVDALSAGQGTEYEILDVTFSESELVYQVGGNDNFRTCNRMIRATGLGVAKNWEVWLWLSAPQGGFAADARCGLFEPAAFASATLFCQQIGLLLDARCPMPFVNDTELLPLDPPRTYQALEDFLEQWRKRFVPLDSILEPLRQRLVRDLCEAIGVGEEGVSCVFSVRAPETNAVHFYATAEQARAVVKVEADVEDFRRFCAYRYGPGAALSGWVMETRSCLYLENFTSSNLWTQYIASVGIPDPEKQAQLTRVSKFFRVEELGHKHAYLLPVLLREENSRGVSPVLRTDIMLSITLAKELDSPIRRHIYELVQRLGSAVSVALDAQQNYEEAVRRAVLAENITPLTRFITHQLANRSNFLLHTIIAGSMVTDQTATACKHVIEDIGKICQIAASYHKYLSKGEQGEELEKEAVRDFSAFIFEVWESAREEFARRDARNQSVLNNSSRPVAGNVPTNFKIHKASVEFLIRNLMSNSMDALDGKTSGWVKLDVDYRQAESIVRIAVSDNGPGFTQDTKQKLLSGLRLSRKPGTNVERRDDYSGYGWYFVRLFCEAHGATPGIPWTTEENQGVCMVTVDFPVLPSASGLAEAL